METNPYQAPTASERVAAVPNSAAERSPADLPLGACCLFIAVWLALIGISQDYSDEEATAIEVGAAVALLADFTLAFSLMGIGLLRHSNRIVWAGFGLLTLPSVPLIAYLWR